MKPQVIRARLGRLVTRRLEPAGRGVRNTLNRDHVSSSSGTFHGRKSEISDFQNSGVPEFWHFYMDANRKHPICVVKPEGRLFGSCASCSFWPRPNQSPLMSGDWGNPVVRLSHFGGRNEYGADAFCVGEIEMMLLL
jgi:hypothetical protein